MNTAIEDVAHLAKQSYIDSGLALGIIRRIDRNEESVAALLQEIAADRKLLRLLKVAK